MTLRIVGGTYREICREGSWDQLFGSGLRAAAALQAIGPDRSLDTYLGSDDVACARLMAKTFDFDLNAVEVEKTVSFRYEHALSIPRIFPPLHILEPAASIPVTAETVLRFGMVEGDAIVHGNRVVFDPQSPFRPTTFFENGSTAETLALVCNRREARLLSGKDLIEAAGQQLLDAKMADLVVIKSGSQGALVLESSGTSRVPAYRTDYVWPIGSGDVFAAAFAHYWAAGNYPARDAAHLASKAVAYYCNSKSLPIPDMPASEDEYRPIEKVAFSADRAEPQVYLAGPFFNMMQRWLIEEARDALIAEGLSVFSPFHDVGIGVAQEVVPADIDAIQASSIMFAILDGLDAGTLFEVGYARSIGIPVIGFAQDVTSNDLKMLVGSDCQVFDDFVTAIYRLSWTVSG